MTALVIAIGATGAALAWLLRQERRRPSSVPLILRALPVALLLLTLPVFQAGVGMIRAFQAISTSGVSSLTAAAALSIAASRPLALGCLTLLIAIGIIAIVQRRTDARLPAPVGPPEPGTADPSPGGAVSHRIPGLTPLVLLPAGALVLLVHYVTSLVMEAAVALIGDAPSSVVAGMTLSELSEVLATRLIVTVAGGGALSIGLVLLGALNLFPLQPRPASAVLARWGWATVAIAGVMAAVLFARLMFDIRGFERLF